MFYSDPGGAVSKLRETLRISKTDKNSVHSTNFQPVRDPMRGGRGRPLCYVSNGVGVWGKYRSNVRGDKHACTYELTQL